LGKDLEWVWAVAWVAVAVEAMVAKAVADGKY
jgi:hypothetical protein